MNVPDLLGENVGPGEAHAHPDGQHGYFRNGANDLRLHLEGEHGYVAYKTQRANKRLHRSLHTEKPAWLPAPKRIKVGPTWVRVVL